MRRTKDETPGDTPIIDGGGQGVSEKKPVGDLTPAGSDCCDAAGEPAGLRYWDGDAWQHLDFPVDGGPWRLMVENGVPVWENATAAARAKPSAGEGDR